MYNIGSRYKTISNLVLSCKKAKRRKEQSKNRNCVYILFYTLSRVFSKLLHDGTSYANHPIMHLKYRPANKAKKRVGEKMKDGKKKKRS